MSRSEIFARINSKLIAKLESGVLPWRKSWLTSIPANLFSKKCYQGINYISLACDEVTSPYYFTFLQAKQKNLLIKKGSKGREIIFWKILKKDDSAIQDKDRPFLRTSYVFNLSDTEGYQPPTPTLQQPNVILNSIVETLNPHISTNFERCYYSPSMNKISTPPCTSFESEEEYFCAMFHELIHWTGHPTRLNRENSSKKGDSVYAKEELIAEIGASYILALCGIENTLDNSTAYLNSWLLQAHLDNSYLINAAVAAQKAVNFLLPVTEDTEEVLA